jgi:hypothetical protein
MEADELIALIEEAFPAHPISDVTLRQRALSDQGMSREISKEEWQNAGRIDRDVPWTALSDNDLMECQVAISHLWASEFGYYLGALLRFAARHLDAGIWTREGSLVSTTVYNVVDEPTDDRVRRYVHKRWGALNAARIAAVQAFLEYVVARSDRHGAEAGRALARYWNAAQPKEPDLCPVCGCALDFSPWTETWPSDEMCPCCGIQFGNDDAAGGYLVRSTIYDHWRERWIRAGMAWNSKGIQMPEGWDPLAQLERLKRKT